MKSLRTLILGISGAAALTLSSGGAIAGYRNPPFLNFAGNGGFISLDGIHAWNFGGNGGFIGIHDANGVPVPLQNIGGNGGFIAVVQPAAPQAVLCKLKDQVLIAGALESCEKAGGKAVDPKETAKK